MEPRCRDRRGEAAQQGEGVEVDGDGAVAERLLQGHADEAIGAGQEPFGGDGRPQDVLEEGLAALVVLGTGAGGGVEGEAELADRERRGAQRAAWAAMVQPSPVLKKLRFERATVGGVPGEWFIPSDAAETAPVVLYFNGGSFIYGDAGSTHRELIAREALAAGARTFAADYRLAPEHPFPAAIDDAVAVYRGLLESGVAPSRLVVAGESAGGNLALVTLLRARDVGLPQPSGAVLACPWVDLSARGGSLVEHRRFDWAEPEDFAPCGATRLKDGASELRPRRPRLPRNGLPMAPRLVPSVGHGASG